MERFIIIETDNFGGDYPLESRIALPFMPKESADEIASVINKHCSGNNRPRFWKVEKSDYKLQPGFEP